MYTPVKTPQGERTGRLRTVTPFKGENYRQYSNLLQPANALLVENYLPDAEGKLPKRKGLSKIFERAGTNPVTLLKRFTSSVIVFGYSTTIASYNEITGVITDIKTNFSVNDGFNGVKYGDYFFVCNGVEKIYRINLALTATEVSGGPICKVLNVLGARLLAGNLSTDSTAVAYPHIDDGSNPPFTDWTVGTLATDGGLVNYRNAGDVNDIATLGDNIVVLSEFGKWAFTIDQSNTNGTITKIDNTVIDRRDLGGQKALMTKKAIFYVNQAGLWQLQSLGQPNIPYSDQEDTVSYILGREYFPNINFDKASIAYDEVNQILYVSCKNNGSPSNNYVIAYNTKTGAFSRIIGWSIGVFFTDIDGTIWGGSSLYTKVYKCFQGYDDDGFQIGTAYYQELSAGDFQTSKAMDKFAIQADISNGTEITITFDTYDYQARFVPNTASFLFSATNVTAQTVGYGVESYGIAGYGSGGVTDPSTTPMFDSYKPGFRNFQRVFVRVTSADYLPHSINMFIADITENKDIRKRNITIINN